MAITSILLLTFLLTFLIQCMPPLEITLGFIAPLSQPILLSGACAIIIVVILALPAMLPRLQQLLFPLLPTIPIVILYQYLRAHLHLRACLRWWMEPPIWFQLWTELAEDHFMDLKERMHLIKSAYLTSATNVNRIAHNIHNLSVEIGCIINPLMVMISQIPPAIAQLDRETMDQFLALHNLVTGFRNELMTTPSFNLELYSQQMEGLCLTLMDFDQCIRNLQHVTLHRSRPLFGSIPLDHQHILRHLDQLRWFLDWEYNRTVPEPSLCSPSLDPLNNLDLTGLHEINYADPGMDIYIPASPRYQPVSLVVLPICPASAPSVSPIIQHTGLPISEERFSLLETPETMVTPRLQYGSVKALSNDFLPPNLADAFITGPRQQLMYGGYLYQMVVTGPPHNPTFMAYYNAKYYIASSKRELGHALLHDNVFDLSGV
ncbi:hypothetical protein AX17_006179 [Amanita inopinata Kibby_2008]|nr:hypothetical protein AX17_006179 [Amanita inopinata Kibby_2008]